ncbi:MAG TPA: DedA family protein [Bacillota bacterium]|nr:DedA family protein [Bacillota bacterium]
MNDILQWFYLLFDNWLMLFLFLLFLGMINTFVPPIPLEGLVVLGGYLSGTGHGNLSAVWLAPSLGMLLGGMLLFWIVRLNQEWLFRWKLFKKHLTPEDLDKGHDWFERYGVWAIFISRFIPGMGLVTISTAGLSKMPWYRLTPAIGFVNLLYFGILILIGRFVKEEWELIMDFLKPILSWAGVLLVLVGAVFFLIWRAKKRKSKA